VGLLDALLGRTKPVQANLDRLFALPGARITLEASEDLVPSGQAGVCFKPSAGSAFDATEREIADMLAAAPSDGGGAPSSAELSEQSDEFGYRWVVVANPDFDTLVTKAHYVNSTLQDNGYGPQMLCSVFGFVAAAPPASGIASGPASMYLVYLYKRGTFYPFIPVGRERRDNESELRLKNVLASDLAIESDLDRWFPLWTLPVH